MENYLKDFFLPGVPIDLIEKAYARAPGNELETGKIASLESSAALVANAFGYFLDKPASLPPLPGIVGGAWSLQSVRLEVELRFPWTGGYHPWLDVVVETDTHVVAIESKRYEPFRGKPKAEFSDAYWRDVWGDRMAGYNSVRDGLKVGSINFEHLDAAQLVKHAYGLRSAVYRLEQFRGKMPTLVYLYCEPTHWPNGKDIPCTAVEAHRQDVEYFASMVQCQEVMFLAIRYKDLVAGWATVEDMRVVEHAARLSQAFRF